MNEKLEELLRLALQTPEEVRALTEDLNTGYDAATESWEVIVKYHGNLEGLEPLGIQVEYLLAGYAILTVPEPLVEELASFPQIEYVEKPKQYYYEQFFAGTDSCIYELEQDTYGLTGQGVLLAVLDSGIEYRLPEFRKEDGSSRILELWDQTANRIFTQEEINQALLTQDAREQLALVPSIDATGHGTAVAALAVGNSTAYKGIATEADLLVVKLGLPGERSFPRTTEIMRAVTYAVQTGVELGRPLVINLSFGNTYGAHDGTSLLERFLDNAAEIGRTVICVGSGNEGSNGGHLQGNLLERNPAEIELAVAEYETSLSVQLWKNYGDAFSVFLRSPGGQEVEIAGNIGRGKYTVDVEQTRVLVYVGEPTPYAVAQEIYLELIPLERNYITAGIWSLRLEAGTIENVVSGNYYLYLPSGAVRNEGTGFFRATPEVTLTIPSTAAKVLTVGAYDRVFDSYAEFSGRGYGDATRTIGVVAAGLTKPDLVAPGTNLTVPTTFGGTTTVSGTSFATPIVSGSVALLMEWGIVRGNDVFLYGEKIKAYLRSGARPLRGEAVYPNERVGWGALCVADSLPR